MARSRVNANQPNVIDGVPIGGVTPAAGAFTTLSASGNATLAGNATLSGTTALNGPINVNGAASAAGQIIRSAGPSVAAAWGAALVQGTAQSSTSGTFIDFNGVIPSWARRITVMFSGVSTNGISPIMLRAGTSAGLAVTGYDGSAFRYNTGTTRASTTDQPITEGVTAATALSGTATLTNLTSNTWTISGVAISAGGGVTPFGGVVALAGVLDRLRITTVGGTDLFDGGAINIMWE